MSASPLLILNRKVHIPYEYKSANEVLMALKVKNNQTMKALVKVCDQGHSNLRRTLDKLIAAGWVERVSVGDTRNKVYRLKDTIARRLGK